MEFPEVKRLYKFKSLRDGVDEEGNVKYDPYTVSMLKNNTAWLARPDTFNDPFDCNYRPIPAKIKEGDELFIDDLPMNVVEKNILESLPENFTDREWQRAVFKIAEFRNDRIQNMVKNYCVLSMSEECDHTLLWSHYADQHRGICIQYARTPESIFCNELSRPVRYRKHYFSIDHSDYQVFLKETVYSDKSSEFQNGYNLLTNSIFTKSEQWFYEKEWRVAMHFPQPAKGVDLKLGTSILSVIFGCLTPKEDKEYVKELLGESVRYFQAWKQKMDHGLEIIPEDEWEGRMNFYNQEKDISQFGG